MNVDAELFGVTSDDDPSRRPAIGWQLIVVKAGVGYSRQCGLDLGLGRRARSGNVHCVVWSIQPAFDLWLEKVDRAGCGQPDDKRKAEKSGVGVPTTDST